MWKTSHQTTVWLRRLQEAVETLETENRALREDLAEAKRAIRTFDLDMVGLEDKVKAFTGRISVRKRADRQPPAPVEPEMDLNAAIRDGKLTSWPSPPATS